MYILSYEKFSIFVFITSAKVYNILQKCKTILIAILTIKILSLIELSIRSQFDGLFPYLTTLVSVAWAAYGTSVSFYYNKAKLENKIKLEKLGASKDLLMQEPYIREPKGKIADETDSVDVSDEEDDDGALG